MSQPRYVVERNERVESREGRDGRIRERRLLTWDVVDTKECVLVAEHRTRREAQNHLARILEKIWCNESRGHHER
jgi:hypothetical protein